MTLHELLALAVGQKASDLHLSSGLPPFLRIHGRLQPLARPPGGHISESEAVGT